MKALYENNFPTPVPIDANRHAILMSYVEGYTFQRIKDLEAGVAEQSYHFLLDQIIRLAEHGLIHSDFNEYNIIINDKEPFNVSFIDFPQMVSTDHKEAEMFFYRDVNCIERLFRKKHNFVCERDSQIKFEDIKVVKRLDKEVKASGYWKYAGVKAKEVTQMEAVLERGNEDEEFSDGEFEEQECDQDQISEDGEEQQQGMIEDHEQSSDLDEPGDEMQGIQSSDEDLGDSGEKSSQDDQKKSPVLPNGDKILANNLEKPQSDEITQKSDIKSGMKFILFLPSHIRLDHIFQ